MSNDLRDFPDAKFGELGPGVDNFVMRYNHSKGGFDLVSADGILIKEMLSRNIGKKEKSIIK